MKTSWIVTRARRGFLKALVPAIAASSIGISACADDDDHEYGLTLSSSEAQLAVGSSERTLVSVFVATDSGQAAPAGTQVGLSLQGGDGSGFFDAGDQGETIILTTDAAGTARVQVGCSSSGTVPITAVSGSQRVQLPAALSCYSVPEGGFPLHVTASPRVVGVNSQVEISVSTMSDEGEAAPEGSGIQLEITAGPAAFDNGGRAVIRPTRSDGRANALLIAGEEPGSVNVCAKFTRAEFGENPSCVNIRVEEEPPTEATCTGAWSTLRAPADNDTIVELTFIVRDDLGEDVNGAQVTVDMRRGRFVTGPNDTPVDGDSAATDDSGTVTFRARSETAGTAGTFANAEYVRNGRAVTLTCSIEEDVTFFPPPTCEFNGMMPEQLKTAGFGVDETGLLTFCFVDNDGSPVEEGSLVAFDFVTTIGGSSLSVNQTTTESDGCARVELDSGSQAGQVEVLASYRFGDNDAVCTSGPLAIVGARPTAKGWSLVCDPENIFVPGINTLEQATLYTSASVGATCTTVLRDRFGNPVNDPSVRVFFHSEMGVIESPVSPDANGVVTTRFIPNGIRPRDVEPIPSMFPDEPAITTQSGQTLNSRDNFVTITAWTQGEEGFIDSNGNGVYDQGEIFYDLSEPFFDYNDNNTFDPRYSQGGEEFIDVGRPDPEDPDVIHYDGVFNPPNNRWDAETVIWTQSRILLTGEAAFGPADSATYIINPSVQESRIYSRTHFRNIDENNTRIFHRGTASIPKMGRTRFELVLTDRFGNRLPKDSTVVEMTLAQCPSEVTLDRVPGNDRRGLGVEFFFAEQGYNSGGQEVPVNSTNLASLRLYPIFRWSSASFDTAYTEGFVIESASTEAFTCILSAEITTSNGDDFFITEGWFTLSGN